MNNIEIDITFSSLAGLKLRVDNIMKGYIYYKNLSFEEKRKIGYNSLGYYPLDVEEVKNLYEKIEKSDLIEAQKAYLEYIFEKYKTKIDDNQLELFRKYLNVEGLKLLYKKIEFPTLEEAQKLLLEEDYSLREELKLSVEDIKLLYEKIKKAIEDGTIDGSFNKFHEEITGGFFISSFFERILEHPYFKKGYYRIDITCTDIICKDNILIQGKRETLGEYSGYYYLEIPVDYRKLKTLSNYEKKKEALEFLMIGIRKIAEHQNWDMKPFEEAYNKIIEANYINEWKRDKPKELAKHKTKKIQAGLGTIQDIDKSEIFLFICDNKRNEIYRQTIVTSNDEEYQKYNHSFSISEWKINWKDGYKVSIPNLVPEFELDYIQQAKEALKNEENLNEHIKKEYEELVSDKEKYENLLKEPKELVFKIPLNIIEKAPLI